jgi:hypothetical protein
MMFMMTTPPTTRGDGSDAEHDPRKERTDLFPDVEKRVVGFEIEVVRLAGRVVAPGAHHDTH